jgi:hypothetical protein
MSMNNIEITILNKTPKGSPENTNGQKELKKKKPLL